MKLQKPLALLISSAGIGLAVGAALIYFTPLKYAQLVEPEVISVEARTFYADFEKNADKYLFIDVRDAETYAAGHPKGAINIPLAQLYTKRTELPRHDKEIVLICGGNSASGVAYSYLEHFGFTNIERVPGGYREWLIDGLPYERSTPSTEN